MSKPISTRMPEVTVEYATSKGKKVRKHFADAVKAKAFFAAKDKTGAKPKIVKASKPATKKTKKVAATKSTKVERDAFGSKVGTMRATVNSWLAKQQQGVTVKQIAEATGCKLAFAAGHCRNLREAGHAKSWTKDGNQLHGLKG